ncbi:GNAT family N-acetyltransferase [Streptomyces sp. NBC_01497]|uniref:GNAT family N-acetyltransferase n=1 Tax=Streptomyces sp. NBC_01497 TaxID=2903885 RepID=UPI002E35B39E|nr:GNAT family N-acetyltransferase [Streptomyces sp. NBC_01497]
MIVEPLEPVDGDLPGPLLTELAALYASDHAFQQLSGDFPDPEAIRPEQVAASLADELAEPGAEVLLARSAGRLVAVAVTLAQVPDPCGTRTGATPLSDGEPEGGPAPAPDAAARPASGTSGTISTSATSATSSTSGTSGPDAWIGLLMVHGEMRRIGHGRRLAEVVERRFGDAGRSGVRLGVLESNTRALAFWTALGYEEIDRRPDRRLGRPCVVLRKDLTGT